MLLPELAPLVAVDPAKDVAGSNVIAITHIANTHIVRIILLLIAWSPLFT